MNNELNWKITTLEKRSRLQRMILIVLPMVIVYFFSLQESEGVGMRELIYGLLIAFALVPIFLLINRMLPYKDFTYSLSDDRIVISKGKIKKEYFWDDFEYFFSSLRTRDLPTSEIFSETKSLMGNRYYLRKKKKSFFSKLYKSFVIICSEPGNDEEVLRFLSFRLPKRKKKATDELGLIFYEFKDVRLEFPFIVLTLFLIMLLILIFSVRRKVSDIGPSDAEMRDFGAIVAVHKIGGKFMKEDLMSDGKPRYPNLISCDYDNEMIELCNDIEERIGVMPTIFSNEEEYCVYIKLDRTNNYFCKDGQGVFGGYTLDPDPKEGGGCNGITFDCPNVEESTQLFLPDP